MINPHNLSPTATFYIKAPLTSSGCVDLSESSQPQVFLTLSQGRDALEQEVKCNDPSCRHVLLKVTPVAMTEFKASIKEIAGEK